MPKVTSRSAKVSSRARSNAKSYSKIVTGGGGRKKQGGLLASIATKQWLIAGLVLVVAFGGIGAWKLSTSHAASTTLTTEQCYNRGRTYSISSGTVYCWDSCYPGAGSYVSNVSPGYCTYANSLATWAEKCASLHRDYNWGSGGCARRWAGSVGDRVAKAWQCSDNYWTYVLATPYDYCTKPSGFRAPVSSISLGNGWSLNHAGQDYLTSRGATAFAAHAGTIKRAFVGGASENLSGCGNVIMQSVDGDSSIYLVYFLGQGTKNVTVGQHVALGQVLGTVAPMTSPCGYGSHVHLQVQKASYGTTIWARQDATINPCRLVPGC